MRPHAHDPLLLPVTQLAVRVSTAFFVRPDGDPSGRGGVRPDILVGPAPAQAGDPVIDAAVAALAERADRALRSSPYSR